MPTSASSLTPPPDGVRIEHPRPLTSSAARLMPAGGKVKRIAQRVDWQDEAWDMYDLVGEQHFLASTIAGRMAQARLFVGRLPSDPTEDVLDLDEGVGVDATPPEVARTIREAFESLGLSGPDRLVERMGYNLFGPGEFYFLGTPKAEPPVAPTAGVDLLGIPPEGVPDSSSGDFTWRVCSLDEIVLGSDDNLSVRVDEATTETWPLSQVIVIRVWRSHPRYSWLADSNTRAALPILREIVGFTLQTSAHTDSRLAGAGVLFIPESADRALRAQLGLEDGEDSPFVRELMDAMITPIKDRDAASAVVPLMPVVPDESIDKFRYMSFAAELDAEINPMREAAIRRLALSQDCPPEILLGVAGMNHWGAWIVREDVVATHLEPPLALICDALTTQFLWPVLRDAGIDHPERYLVWFDVSHMVMRPDRSADAKDLYGAGVISDGALREASGFDDSDAPERTATNPAVDIVLKLVSNAPSLATDPGIPSLLESVTALLNGTPPPEDDAPEEPPATPEGDGEEPGADPLPDDAAPSSDAPADGPPNGGSPPALSASAHGVGVTPTMTWDDPGDE